MSIAQDIFSLGKQIILVTDNIKRLEDKVQTLSKDVVSMDRRLIRLETYVEISQSSPLRRVLRGETQ